MTAPATPGTPARATAPISPCISCRHSFAGVRTLERHRMVYAAAAALLAGRIHALQIHALTPAEAAARSSQRSS